MKVLQINSVCGVGSTGRIATDLYKVMKENGIESKIAFGIGNAENIPQEDAFKFGNKFDYYVHNAVSRITDRAGFYSKINTLKLLKFIKSYEPDIIHIHTIHGFYINIEILFKFLKEYKKPVIWTIHDCWPFTGHCAHYSNNCCYKWKTLCEKCPAKKTYPKSYVFSNAKNNYLKKKSLITNLNNLYITTPSKWLADQAKESFLNCFPITTIFNGIDLKTFKPTKSDFREIHNLENKKIILGVSSSWNEQKGLYDFVKLSKMLDENYVVLLVGLSEREKQNLPDNIIALPVVKNIKELAEIYTNADIYVSLSVEETFGLPTVEAMACGTPVLTYDKTALPEPVNEYCGVVVPAKNVKMVYEKIINFPEFNAIEVRNQAFRFDKEKVYQEFIDLYKKIY